MSAGPEIHLDQTGTHNDTCQFCISIARETPDLHDTESFQQNDDRKAVSCDAEEKWLGTRQ